MAHCIHLPIIGWFHRQKSAYNLTTNVAAPNPPLIHPQAVAYSASRTSKLVQHLQSIFISTYAILFLRTPHNGSNKASLASVGRRIIHALVPFKALDTDGQLLDALLENS